MKKGLLIITMVSIFASSSYSLSADDNVDADDKTPLSDLVLNTK